MRWASTFQEVLKSWAVKGDKALFSMERTVNQLNTTDHKRCQAITDTTRVAFYFDIALPGLRLLSRQFIHIRALSGSIPSQIDSRHDTGSQKKEESEEEAQAEAEKAG